MLLFNLYLLNINEKAKSIKVSQKKILSEKFSALVNENH